MEGPPSYLGWVPADRVDSAGMRLRDDEGGGGRGGGRGAEVDHLGREGKREEGKEGERGGGKAMCALIIVDVHWEEKGPQGSTSEGGREGGRDRAIHTCISRSSPAMARR